MRLHFAEFTARRLPVARILSDKYLNYDDIDGKII